MLEIKIKAAESLNSCAPDFGTAAEKLKDFENTTDSIQKLIDDLEKYNQSSKPINLFKTLRYQMPYTMLVGIILLALLIVWFIIGLPIGIHGVVSI